METIKRNFNFVESFETFSLGHQIKLYCNHYTNISGFGGGLEERLNDIQKTLQQLY